MYYTSESVRSGLIKIVIEIDIHKLITKAHLYDYLI